MTAKKNILIIDINHWDREQLSRTNVPWENKYNLLLYEYESRWFRPSFDALTYIEDTIKKFKCAHITGIASSGDYPGCILAAAIAGELGFPAPTPESVLTCSHKYYSRLAQREAAPKAAPLSILINPGKIKKEDIALDFPLFIKPVKSWSSVLARRVDSFDEMKSFLSQPTVRRFKSRYLRSFNRLIERYTKFKSNGGCFLAEQLMQGHQVTVEGFVFRGDAQVFAVVDSTMYPGTISFERFEYPSSLPESVQLRMACIAKKVLRRIGYDNGMFNIEMFYDAKKDLIQIVEINPRMVGQFADLLEKVDGTNTYEIMLALAAGERPVVKKREGKFKVAASFVLRCFEDKRIVRLPDRKQISDVKRLMPETLVHLFYEEGERMSDYEHMDDVESYSYAMINMGAQDRSSLLAAFDQAKKRLTFSFADID